MGLGKFRGHFGAPLAPRRPRQRGLEADFRENIFVQCTFWKKFQGPILAKSFRLGTQKHSFLDVQQKVSHMGTTMHSQRIHGHRNAF